MKIKDLTLKNIGPFKNANLQFFSSEDSEQPPVVFITGENGTGKSIIIDSIRALLSGRFHGIERDIASENVFSIQSNIILSNKTISLIASKKHENTINAVDTDNMEVNKLFVPNLRSSFPSNFIFDYWTSKLSNDPFVISNIAAIDVDKYLSDSLTGIHKNIDLVKCITFFDYLKDSTKDDERELGNNLYKMLENIVSLSISNGRLSHVSRINLKPIVKIGQREVSLDKLSSGNLYILQRFARLLSQVYSICVTNNISISEYQKIEGVLLIDEAENHLHPKWQKVFLQNILKVFPKIQMIVSTHSPFIVSSIKKSKVFVCKSKIDHATIEEETDYYSSMPIEEVLLSPLFNTRNFSEEISVLLDSRKKAIEEKNDSKIEKIESELIQINPEYFDYLNLDKIIKQIKK